MKQEILNDQIVRHLFDQHYTELCLIALRFLRSPEQAEDIVQEVFLQLWKHINDINKIESHKAYLIKSVKNRCINELSGKYHTNKSSIKPINDFDQLIELNTPVDIINEKELLRILDRGLKQLPEKCYTIFALSRFSELSNKEIAKKLNISVKTVENQITIAIKKIKAFLEKNWPVFLLIGNLETLSNII